MEILIKKDYEKISKKAANLIKKQINKNPRTVLGLPTGSTPFKMYQELIRMHQKGEIDFSNVVTFNLDEYYGLPADHPQSYHKYMWENFFKDINIKKENINILDGMTDDVKKECQKYEDKINKVGGIDLQILGIGSNGHIGFNEPGESLKRETHLVNLTEETRKANSRFFESIEAVPKKALTMGISTILKSDRIILMAAGEQKASVIKETIYGEINTQTPATLLQTHPEVTLIVDKKGAKYII